MHLSSIPRHVRIGDAATFVGTTPRAIRHYHEIGLLPEPERGGDGNRLYGYDDVIRLLWIRRTAEAGIALDDIAVAFSDAGPADGTGEQQVGDVLDRLERSLVEQQEELRRQQAAVQRMRAQGSRVGLLSDVVADRLAHLPAGSLRTADLDSLLVTERLLGAGVAAVQASRFITLTTDPDLREESDRIEAAEEALDDTVAVDDPRVAQVAAERYAFEARLQTVVEESGLGREDEALLDSWIAQREADGADTDPGRRRVGMREALTMVPYDFSPARLRCMELSLELAAQETPAG
ncbi:MerR family transcriptional regulator [Nocardioides zeae]|uniref:MerR family transcriptional regulator n=1 Tax=Nocardioides imazamoxiresistens TaxID=3231893 RepID=A0ABU3PV99_9ACTN|nr:MerR family transcriptional regulator [Nocardioides zeae]MDT9593171.1 MerR family transcriptional regulator [Nocardioides zeae]